MEKEGTTKEPDQSLDQPQKVESREENKKQPEDEKAKDLEKSQNGSRKSHSQEKDRKKRRRGSISSGERSSLSHRGKHRRSISRDSRDSRRRHRRDSRDRRHRRDSRDRRHRRRRSRDRRRRRSSSSRSRFSSDSRDDQQGKTVYVANLSKKVDERELRDKFRKYGRIDNYNIVYDPIVRESRGFGFVTFESKSDAQDAVRDLDGLEFEGRDLIVQIAKRSKPRKSTPGKYLGYDKYRGRRDRSGSRRRRRSYSYSSRD